MRCEVVAIGSELLLGQIVDTNSSWIGQQLAVVGIDSHHQTKVGDNLDRIVSTLRLALERSEAVIVCGGLGPTQDDITREAVAAVMGVGLVRDDAVAARIEERFTARGRAMAANNLRQADIPEGAQVMAHQPGTAPGLICPVGARVVYCVPGVPYEMQEMVAEDVIADLRRRAGDTAVIVSRTLRTWGESESALAERLAPRIEALEAVGNPTLAFLASGIEGIKVRITAKATSSADARRIIDAEEQVMRAELGRLVFGVDDETMEHAVGVVLAASGRTLGLAESMTGGLIASRITSVAGASTWFRGSLVTYGAGVKQAVLGLPDGPVVTEAAAEAMATGACRVLDADVGLSVTGVAGPAEQDGEPVGTVIVGIAAGDDVSTHRFRLPGDRQRVRQFAAISSLDRLRHGLLDGL